MNNQENNNDKRSREEINRENAQHSTGPRSPEGLARSSQNAVKHGAYRALSCDDLLKIEEIYRTFLRDNNAEGPTEQLQVRIMAEAWHRKLMAERWFFGCMEKHYQQHPLEHTDPSEPASSMEDYETWVTNKKEIQSLDRIIGMFLGRYERAFRRLQTIQKNRIREEARIARSGEDRRTAAPVDKGKLWDLTFAMHAALVKIQNEARERSLQPSRKVEPPPDGEKQ